MEHPVLLKRRALSPIWFLPFLALCISGWLLYSSYQDAGISITIHFKTAEGITPGKTKIIYKGIPVGTVTDVLINPDLDTVIVRVEMDKETRPSLVEDTAFWIVKPVVSAGRISGLQTLFSGSYISIRRGKSTVARRDFIGFEDPPPVTSDLPGLHLRVESDALYSLQRRSHVYSKNLKIGVVDDYHLNDDGKMTIDIFIRPEFSHLIHEGTRFWNASGLSISGNLQSGLSVNVASMASLIYGGLACATPEPLAESPPARDGMKFHLYKDFEDAEYGIPMTLQLASGAGIVAGKTKVMFRGLKAGVVRSLDINNDTFHTVTANILLDPRAEKILRSKTKFWVIRPQVSIEGIKNIDTLLSGPFITFQVGDGVFTDHFTVDSSPMPKPFLRPGKRFTLLSENSGSLVTGRPVLYKQREVGEITDIRFTEDGKKIQTEILIYDQYVHLLRQDVVFWNASGVEINGSLTNFSVNLDSLRSVLAGGIAFSNPVSSKRSTPLQAAANTKPFTLYSSHSEAIKHVPAMHRPGLLLKLNVAGGAPIREGAPVLFNKIPVGEVLGFELKRKNRHIEGTILIYKEYTRLVNATSRFYNASGIDIDASLQGISLDIESLDSVISGGISFFTPAAGKPAKEGDYFPLYSNLDNALQADSLILTLQLKSGTGVNSHTKIRYQGVVIGSLNKVWFDPEKGTVLARAVVQKNTAGLFREQSVLWLVKPQIDLSGIRHLSTAITGSYIDLHPGPGQLSKTFVVLDRAPSVQSGSSGLNIVLEAPRLGSLKISRPVYYRQVRIGTVTGVELSPTAQNVWVHVNIRPEYQNVVHRGTRFWHASGINVSGSLFSGISVDAESIEALLAGGVAMATPEGEAMGKPAQNGDHFIMAEKAEDSWLEWAPEINLARKTTPVPQDCNTRSPAENSSDE